MSFDDLTRLFAMGGYLVLMLLSAFLMAFFAFMLAAIFTESTTISVIAAAVAFLWTGAAMFQHARHAD